MGGLGKPGTRNLEANFRYLQHFALSDLLITFAQFRGVAQLASALAWGARGRLFESDHPDKKTERGVAIYAIPLFLSS